MFQKKAFIYSAVILSMICWSMSFVWYKSALEYFEPLSLIFFRLIISSVLLFAFTISIKKLQIPNRKDFLFFIKLAVFTPLLYFIGECYGMKYVSSTVGSVIISTIPLFTPFAGYFIYKERLSILNFAGIFVSLTGVLFIVLDQEFTLKASATGVALLMLAVFSAIAYSILLKKIGKKYNSLSIITWHNGIGVFLFAPLVLIFEFDSLKNISFTMEAMRPLFQLAIFASSLAFILFAYSIKKLGVAKASIFTNAIPAFTAIFAFIIMGELLDAQKITGIIIVISGLFLSQLKSRKEKTT